MEEVVHGVPARRQRYLLSTFLGFNELFTDHLLETPDVIGNRLIGKAQVSGGGGIGAFVGELIERLNQGEVGNHTYLSVGVG